MSPFTDLRQKIPSLKNLKRPTLGGWQFWGDVWVRAGWRVQRSAANGLHRVINPKGIQMFASDHAACLAVAQTLAPQDNGTHVVVLLHGMGRTRLCMARMARGLARDGFRVVSIGYPSLRAPLEAHAAQVAEVLNHVEGADRVSFVTHSLGGLVLRALLARTNDPWRAQLALGRALLLAPPNQGSSLALSISKLLPFRTLGGPCADIVLPKGATALPGLDIPFLVVAGGTGGRGYNPWLVGDNDGIVTVAETQLPGAAAHVTLRLPHTTIMMNRAVIAFAARWLRSGDANFVPPETQPHLLVAPVPGVAP